NEFKKRGGAIRPFFVVIQAPPLQGRVGVGAIHRTQRTTPTPLRPRPLRGPGLAAPPPKGKGVDAARFSVRDRAASPWPPDPPPRPAVPRRPGPPAVFRGRSSTSPAPPAG